MKRLLSCTTVILVVFVATSCSLVPEVSTEELEHIVRRDGVPFAAESIPDEVLDRLASYRVVLVGETHFLREHRELLVELLRELHGRGFRQLLVEWTQVANWLLADFVNEGGLEPDWEPPGDISAGVLARAIRDFNRTLPESERIQIYGIDVTLQDYGGDESFLWSLGRLTQHLTDPGPLSEFPQGEYDTPERQMAQLEALQAELNASRSELIAAWGQYWYGTIVETVEVELASIPVRALRERDYDRSVRLREDAIKWLADRRLQDFRHGTLINVGSTHAQKKRLFGTEIEWLGDYLVHESQAADGSVIVLDVSAAHIVSVPGSGIPDYDLTASPENELFRVMNQTWPDQIVFLPTDDPLFSSRRVPINSEGTIYVGAPKRHYDVFVLLPLAHRERFGP
jgi:hypothetical protein